MNTKEKRHETLCVLYILSGNSDVIHDPDSVDKHRRRAVRKQLNALVSSALKNKSFLSDFTNMPRWKFIEKYEYLIK